MVSGSRRNVFINVFINRLFIIFSNVSFLIHIFQIKTHIESVHEGKRPFPCLSCDSSFGKFFGTFWIFGGISWEFFRGIFLEEIFGEFFWDI